MFKTHLLFPKQKKNLKKALKEIGVSDYGCQYMPKKSFVYNIKVQDLSVPAAQIIKQEMLSRGGEVAVHRNTIISDINKTDIIISGTEQQFEELYHKLKLQQFKLPQLADQLIEIIFNAQNKPMPTKIAEQEWLWGKKTYIMGIVNTTPDSFSDGGKFYEPQKAIAHAKSLIEAGADIIDIGGESTRPDHKPITNQEEIDRVLPVIIELAKSISVPISIDTYKSEVAEAAIKAGASIINDIWGFKKDPQIAALAKKYNCPAIIMHNQDGVKYEKDIMTTMVDHLQECINIGLEAGLEKAQMIVDPGIGFGKNWQQNLEVLNRLDELKTLGLPILLAASRKRTIGKVLNEDIPEKRIFGDASIVALGIKQGADIVRVHDVAEMSQVAKMTDAICRD